MGKTIVEKVFSKKSHSDVHAGDVITAEVDTIMMNDASGPLAIDFFEKMGVCKVAHPERVVAIIDHYVPCPNSKVAQLQQMLFSFKDKYGIKLIPSGGGIAHQVLDELKCVAPGKLIVGCDSHSTTHGYLGSVGIGIGASDLACSLISGELWFKVPETILVKLTGSLNKGICGKDVALYLLKKIGGDGANYKCLEFTGSGLASLSMDDRRTICNLAAESCAKCAIMSIDDKAKQYMDCRGIDYSDFSVSDSDAIYAKEIEIDLSKVPCMLSLPSTADNAVPLAEKKGLRIDMAVIGTCTNGRIGDFEEIDRILSKTEKKFAVETLVIPASAEIYSQMMERGYAKKLIDRGAMILPPGCGPCCGSSPGTPRDGFNVISTANRNFIGRMGNVNSYIYLASPSSVACSALLGVISTEEDLDV